jgi:hypothetical protein
MAMAASVREIVVPANLEALNVALAENQVQPEKVISVLLEPGTALAQGEGPKYRVLYRL